MSRLGSLTPDLLKSVTVMFIKEPGRILALSQDIARELGFWEEQSEYIAALYNREISIHWAWKMRNAAHEHQLDALGRFRFAKGLTKEIRQRSVSAGDARLTITGERR